MRRACTVGLLVTTLVWVSAAQAKKLPPGVAAIQQYIEAVPTAGGSVPVGTSSHATGSSHAAPLPASVTTRLNHAGATGAALEQLATSPAYGAPQTRAPATKAKTTRPKATPSQPKPQPRVAAEAPAVPNALASAGHVFSASTAVRVVVAAAALMLVGLAAAGFRRRRT